MKYTLTFLIFTVILQPLSAQDKIALELCQCYNQEASSQKSTEDILKPCFKTALANNQSDFEYQLKTSFNLTPKELEKLSKYEQNKVGKELGEEVMLQGVKNCPELQAVAENSLHNTYYPKQKESLDTNDTKRKLIKLDSLIALDTQDNPSYNFMKGVLSLDLGNTNEALKYLEIASKGLIKKEVHLLIAILLNHQGQFKKALKHNKTALKLANKQEELTNQKNNTHDLKLLQIILSQKIKNANSLK